jgi:hypothetical protein
MTTNLPPKGQRFSHVYVARGEPTQDSQRMRRRIASLIGAIRDLGYETGFDKRAEEKLGIATPSSSSSTWTGLLAKWDLADVLDLVTVAYRFLEQRLRTGFFQMAAPDRWLTGVQEIFDEENVHYTVDDRGGVHFKFDKEFAANAAAAIAALQSPRYANARDNHEKSLAALSAVPPDGKTSIRANFAAVEAVFKLLLPSSPRLTASEAQQLLPLVQKMLAGDAAAQSATAKILNAFKDWVDAAHVYRHEQRAEDPVQPPIELAISIISIGSTHLRWLAEIDAHLQKASTQGNK